MRRSRPHCFGSIRCLIRSGEIRGLRNLWPRPRRTARSNDACELANRLQWLSTHSLVMAEAAFPHEVCPGPREQQPAGLDRKPPRKFSPVESAKKDGDREQQLVIKRQKFHHGV